MSIVRKTKQIVIVSSMALLVSGCLEERRDIAKTKCVFSMNSTACEAGVDIAYEIANQRWNGDFSSMLELGYSRCAARYGFGVEYLACHGGIENFTDR